MRYFGFAGSALRFTKSLTKNARLSQAVLAAAGFGGYAALASVSAPASSMAGGSRALGRSPSNKIRQVGEPPVIGY
jgi:hypothetical protein